MDLTIRGLRTRVHVEGDGPPLLLLGGFWGELAAWRDLLPYLGDFRTIAFDPPGIGGTETPAYPLGLRALARFALAVLDALDHRRAHVLGLSFGGVLAQQLAVAAPHRVDRLVLVSTSAGLLDLPGQATSLTRLAVPLLTARPGRLFGGRVGRDPGLLKRLRLTPPHGAKANVYRLAGLGGRYAMPWSIRRPTLVLTGDDDPLVPPSSARILAALIPGAKLVIVPGGGHLMLFDSPEVVGPIVAGHLPL